MIKLSKIVSFLNLNKIVKTEFGKFVYTSFKRNRGYLDLLANMVQIYLAAHY